MPININMKVDPADIDSALRNSIRTHMNAALGLVTVDLTKDIQDWITSLLVADATYQSILGGDLRAEFGLENPDVVLQEILTILRDSVIVSYSPVRFNGNNLQGGIVIKAIKDDFSDILSSGAATYMSNQFKVEWLKWLISEGDSIIIADYRISYDLTPKERANSRTGVALMKKGSGWKVPAQYAGIISDNFITKIFQGVGLELQLSKILEQALARRL